MFPTVQRERLKPREQGEIGELSAMEWLASKGAHLYVPIGHSPDIDIVAEMNGRLLRVEVKTTAHQNEAGRWQVHISTRGGNQSWTGTVKYFDPERFEYLFVHVGDGRRWFIPSGALDCRVGLTLGGAKYADFEVDRGRPLRARDNEAGLESLGSGEYRSGQTGRTVNSVAKSFGGSNPPSPIRSPSPLEPSKYERKLGQSGRAVINQKRRITIPQRAFFEAGFENGSKVRVRSDGPGRIVLEQVELPGWADNST
jgi:Holliday junction resolvase-like predicted endonuclease